MKAGSSASLIIAGLLVVARVAVGPVNAAPVDAAPVNAASVGVAPGAYLMPSGCCALDVRASGDREVRFSIRAEGANGHSCGLSGRIDGDRALLREAPSLPACELRFVATEGAVEVVIVDGAAAACRGYCGARARFDGVYRRPQPGCARSEVAATRKAFKQAYDSKDFTRAQALLEPVVARCSGWLHWLDAGWIRNDFALAQLRAGDAAGCRQTLSGFGPLIDATEDELRDQHSYPPSDATSLAAVLRAARYNRKRCGGEPVPAKPGG
jgi:hypothetical protein